MEEAVEKIQEWTEVGNDKMQLDLSNLGLTEVPELPYGLRSLNCSYNYLTSLPDTLPVSLVYLDCSNNRLISLPPQLPTRLKAFYCSNNELTSLSTSLPASLEDLRCDHNYLTSLPSTLPSRLDTLICSNNKLSAFSKTLPDSLSWLDCSYNYSLHSIPDTIPEGLIRFLYYDTPLDLEGNIPEVEDYNARRHRFITEDYINHEFLPYRFEERKKRIINRCATIKEALMESCWHPGRLAAMIERFGSVPQWNHELREYGTFDFTSLDEVL